MKVRKLNKILIICCLLVSTSFLAISQVKKSTNINNPNSPEITFENKVYDYGSIIKNGNGSTEFTFKNTGKQPLILFEVKTSCGCTTPTWPKEPIMPGKTGVIKVVYDTKEIGVFSKTITVNSNAKTGLVELTIMGEVYE